MKKTIFVVLALVLALGTLGLGVAFAQTEQPPADETPTVPFSGRGGMRGMNLDGDLHAYKLAAFAEKLGLSVDDVTAQVEAGARPYEIALENGIVEADLPTFMQEIHQAALEAAVADGVLTQEQADFMIERMQSRGMHGDGTCDHDGERPADGSGFGGRGGMGGGRGGHGGGFFNQQP